MSAVPLPRRKSARSEGHRGPLCYCGKVQEDCGCKVFQPRPCARCKHGHHEGACECGCTEYRVDKTPEFLLRQGIRVGEWGITSRYPYEGLMRPGQETIIRVWACVMLYITDRRGRGASNGRLAVYIEDTKPVPLTPAEIMRKLNALDTIPRLDRHAVRKALRELERLGFVRVTGTKRGQVRIFVYAKPLAARKLAPLPDPQPRMVKDDDDEPEPDPEDSDSEGVRSDPLDHLTPRDSNSLRGRILLPLRPLLVKTLREAMRQELASRDLKGVGSDPLKLVETIVDKVLEGVWSDYQKLILGVCEPENSPEKANENEVSAPSSYLVVTRPLSDADHFPEEVSQSVLADRPTHDEIRDAIPKDLRRSLQDEPTDALLDQISTVMVGVPLERLTFKIRARRRSITSLGVIKHFAEDVAKTWSEEAAERALVERAEAEHGHRMAAHAVESAWSMYRDPRSTDSDRRIAKEALIDLGAWKEELAGGVR